MRTRTWTEDQLRNAVNASTSYRGVLQHLGLKMAGGSYNQIHKYIREYQCDISHFKGHAWNRGLKGTGVTRIPLSNILVLGSDFQSFKLKTRLFKEKCKIPQCEECGWKKYSIDGRLPLELDHINGNHRDNRLENLRILCPNCHSLKPTHRGANKRKRPFIGPGGETG